MVRVVGAPGFEDFEAEVFPGMHRIPVDDERRELTVVHDENGELFVVPSSTIVGMEVES